MIEMINDTTPPSRNEGSASMNATQGVGARRRAQRRSSCSAISESESPVNPIDLHKDWMMTNTDSFATQKEDQDQPLDRFNQSFSGPHAFSYTPSLDGESTKSCDNAVVTRKTHRQSRRSSWHAASMTPELPNNAHVKNENVKDSDKFLPDDAETAVFIPAGEALPTSEPKRRSKKQSRRSSWHVSCPIMEIPTPPVTQTHQSPSQHNDVLKSEKFESSTEDAVVFPVEEAETAASEPKRRSRKQSRRSSWHASSPLVDLPTTAATTLIHDNAAHAEVEFTVPNAKDEPPKRSGRAQRRSSWHASVPTTSHEVIEHDEVDLAHVQRTMMMIKHIHMGATRRTSLSNSTDRSLGGPTITESLNTGGRRMNRRASWAGCGEIASEVSLDNQSTCGSEMTFESFKPDANDKDLGKVSDLPTVVAVGRQRMARRPSKKEQSLDISCMGQPPQDTRIAHPTVPTSPVSINVSPTSNGSRRMNRRSSWSGSSLPSTSEASLQVDTLSPSSALIPLTPMKKKDASGLLSADSFATARTYIVDLDDPDTPVEGGRPMTIPLTHSPKPTSKEAGKERFMWGIKNKSKRNPMKNSRSSRSHSPKMNDRFVTVSSANMPLSDDEDVDFDQLVSCVQLTCLGDVATCNFADSQAVGLDYV